MYQEDDATDPPIAQMTNPPTIEEIRYSIK